MSFPSQYLDIVIIRDELTVKLIQMSENRLVINATNTSRVEEMINSGENELQVTLSAQSPEGPAMTMSFNLTFVCKDDTDIYPVSKDKIDQRILYNCGNDDFSFAIGGYFNGPNYELQPQ